MKELYYILDANKLAIPVDLETWGYWLEENTRNRKRIIAQEDIGSYWVSTVFLGIDHGFNSELPILFETMIFNSGGHGDLYCDRCGTWDQAVDMHERAVAEAMAWLRQLPVIYTQTNSF